MDVRQDDFIKDICSPESYGLKHCILQLDRAAKNGNGNIFGNLINVYLVSFKKKLIGSPTNQPTIAKQCQKKYEEKLNELSPLFHIKKYQHTGDHSNSQGTQMNSTDTKKDQNITETVIDYQEKER